jgi:hypothetical protein
MTRPGACSRVPLYPHRALCQAGRQDPLFCPLGNALMKWAHILMLFSQNTIGGEQKTRKNSSALHSCSAVVDWLPGFCANQQELTPSKQKYLFEKLEENKFSLLARYLHNLVFGRKPIFNYPRLDPSRARKQALATTP